MSIQTIEPQDLHSRMEDGADVDVIDVRTPLEFQEVHATMARNEPLDSLDPERVMKQRSHKSNEPLYILCRSGQRAQKACEKFVAAGYENVAYVNGGTTAWDASGLPVIRGKKVMSLERQVRIAAGSLVLLGSILTFANPWFIAVPIFVGSGLIFAGVTDTCGMGMMLAKMPWNQMSKTNSPASGSACQANPG